MLPSRIAGQIIFLSIIILATCPLSYAKRGCCSWHGGVASCDFNVGRQVCRDGTYSPSCICETKQQNTERKNNKYDNSENN